MTSRLQAELKQRKPFTSLEHEAIVGIARTAAVLEHSSAEVFKAHGLTPTQFNVLRILRGSEPEGLCRHEVRDRMVAQVPDVTRLLDRLVDMGLVERSREGHDRRFVRARITKAGLDLLRSLDDVVRSLHREQLGHMGDEKLRRLIRLLDEVRSRD